MFEGFSDFSDSLLICCHSKVKNKMKEFLGDSPFRRLVDFFGNRSKSLDLKFQKKKKKF